MKFIKTTLVDAITGIPCTEAPTKNGHKHPEGFSFLFLKEGSLTPSLKEYPTPDIYGFFEGEEIPQHCQEIGEDEFWSTFKQEILDRAHEKRKQVELGGLYIGDVFIKTDEDDQNKINRVIERATDAGISEVSFKAASGFIEITIEELRGIAISIAHHVQECFSWEAAITREVEALNLSKENVQDAFDIIRQIEEFSLINHPHHEDSEIEED